ncbi:MAG: hypothetical protein L0H70_01515 [Xanthomonadales bacterium]|nr:hypothetical protein [Xanthomonadales bacterium]
MKRPNLYATIASLLLTGSAAAVLAQPAATPPPTHTGTANMGQMYGPQRHYGDFQPNAHSHARSQHAAFGPAAAVISDLHQLQRLYIIQGKSAEMIALYKHVLSRSKNQRVRNYVYTQLAKVQSQPANVSSAIVTLRQSLDENLTVLDQAKLVRKP